MARSIVDVLMDRDGMTEEEALREVEEARNELYDRLGEGDMPFDICMEFFGLEEDYIMELI